MAASASRSAAVNTSPTGKITTYGYDWLNRRTSTSDPDAGTTTSEYYPSGAVKHSRDGKGVDLFTTLDVLSRPTAVYNGTTANGALLTKTVYDGTLLGTVTSQISYVGSTAGTGGNPGTAGTPYTQAFGYDSRYRVTRTDQTVPASVGTGLSGTFSTTYAFDGLGRPTSVTYPSAGGLGQETVTTTYNGAYAASLSSPSGTYVASTNYTGIGQVASQILGTATGSVLRSTTWDVPTGRPVAQAAVTPSSGSTTTLQNVAYTWSPTGDATKITDVLAGQQQCYSYDTQHRLVAASTSTTTGTPGTKAGADCTPDTTGPVPYNESYSYDTEGNLTNLIHNGVGKTFTYGTDITTSGAIGGPHAPTGTTSAGVNTTYAYDADGQLTTKVASGATTSTTTYTWDPQGRLASTSAAGQTSNFTYGPDGARWVRATPTETVVYLAGQELHLSTSNGATVTVLRYYSFGGSTVAVRKTGTSGGLFWILTDQQGSLSLSVNAADGTKTQDRYLPYGGSRATTAGGSPLFTLPTDRGWIGQVQDKDTGLDYLNARYYDPGLAHFISTDPLNIQATPATANPYAYAADNPITYSDPNGAELGSWCTTSACNTSAAIREAALQKARIAAVAAEQERKRKALAAARARAIQQQQETQRETARLQRAAAQANAAHASSGAPGMNFVAPPIPWAAVDKGIAGAVTRVGGIATLVLSLGGDSSPEQRKAAEEDADDQPVNTKSKDSNQRLLYITYTLINKAGVVYSGRASGYGTPEQVLAARLSGHHMVAQGFVSNGQAESVAYAQLPPSADRHNDPAYQAIRGREQQLIDYFGGAQSDYNGTGTSGNSIRGVARDNVRGPQYWAQSNAYFGELCAYSGNCPK